MLKILGLVAIFSAAVFAASIVGLMIGYSQQPPQQESHPQNSAEYENKQHYREKEIPFWQRATTDPVAAFTLWLVIFTAVLGGTSILQYGSLIRGETTSAKAAQAAKDAAEVSRDTLLIGQRAYVYATFQPGIVKNSKTKNVEGWTLTPVWNNSGPTPTRNLRNHISFKAFEGNIPHDWHFPDIWPKVSKPEERINILLPLGPRSVLNGQSIFFDVQTLRDAIAGKKTLYIWGWAEYNDVFPGTPIHVSRFASRIVVGGDPTNPEKFSISYPLLQHYNCADGECELSNFPASWKAAEELE